MAEKEYIERDAVIELAKSNKAVCSCLADIVDVMQIVNDIPTADVQFVVHAKWIFDGDCIICSNCQKAYKAFCGSNFCPNCGAIMD